QKDYLVIGLGRFGRAVCESLVKRGQSVLGVDIDPKLVQEASNWLTQAVILDSTDREALEEIEAQQFSTAIVAIGANFEASILTTIVLKDLGIPRVISKALTTLHERVLLKVGADEVIFPERQAGYALGEKLSS
ncbi:MAG TPA: TrkA family potassium uptake protein, partial [Chloroflexia bacterium]|nr:TrkA family potassium uptake protein [Chloroflexia bacterium]